MLPYYECVQDLRGLEVLTSYCKRLIMCSLGFPSVSYLLIWSHCLLVKPKLSVSSLKILYDRIWLDKN
jgi:hypothetical protein